MKKALKLMTCSLLALVILFPTLIFAAAGDCGYEGGISSGEVEGKTSYDYQEVCFLTGEPIVFKGTITVKKTTKQDMMVTTYLYSLKNLDRSATLSRSLIYNTTVTTEYNGQKTEKTVLSGTPTETVKVGANTYIMKSYDFARSNIIDPKPAVNYFAGSTWGRKTYQAGTTTTGGTITVETTGSFYGYNQYWGTAEVQSLHYLIQAEQKKGNEMDRWGGTASVTLSSTMTKQLNYIQNEPVQISFEGGYVQNQYNSSIMQYTCQLPEFDAGGVSTDRVIKMDGGLNMESFPVQTRLPVPSIPQLRGHWSENDVKILYSLGVFKGNEQSFNPQQYMSRAEFATAIVNAAREVPELNTTVSYTSPTATKSKQAMVSPYIDVSVNDINFEGIYSAFQRGLMAGRGKEIFAPKDMLTVADTLVVFVRALGLEGMAPATGAVTTFIDNDTIPVYARNAAYVAEKIGLIKGDDKGYLKPNEYVTKARAGVMMNRLINYMRQDIMKDYSERMVNYK